MRTADVPILARHWECVHCQAAARTVDDKIPMHPCPGMKGLMTPLIPQGTKAKVEAVEREDYIGKEIVQTDCDGRPVMAIVTTRDDGQDCAVLAPTARVVRD